MSDNGIQQIIAPVFESIPTELQDRGQWVFWRETERDGKKTKIPVDLYRSNASTTEASTWSDFETVVIHYNEATDAGIGFVFTNDDELRLLPRCSE